MEQTGLINRTANLKGAVRIHKGDLETGEAIIMGEEPNILTGTAAKAAAHDFFEWTTFLYGEAQRMKLAIHLDMTDPDNADDLEKDACKIEGHMRTIAGIMGFMIAFDFQTMDIDIQRYRRELYCVAKAMHDHCDSIGITPSGIEIPRPMYPLRPRKDNGDTETSTQEPSDLPTPPEDVMEKTQEIDRNCLPRSRKRHRLDDSDNVLDVEPTVN